jgi:hypothetical protein
VSLGQHVDLLGALGILVVVVFSPAGVNGIAHQLESFAAAFLARRGKGGIG